ncbi:PDZ domain-containing protein [Fodinisporobacter ferrooxydans]|uniref:endopeptidase La n=1 Tax=Fodinisporobacter ferrooxydans TaxID=2901836 RepID=A0ABY4CFC7_9BACL|nr:PDZ domain-containing protein [Alicyclobacillaceae bacterium MYW30-H2]
MTGPQPQFRRKLGLQISGVCIAILLILGAVVPLPYFVEYPGSAESLQPIITVEGGHKIEKGTFMLTTVSMLRASNVYYFLYGLAQSNSEVKKKSEVDPGMSEADYHYTQQYMMDSAKQNAVASALSYLGKPVTVRYLGVEVLSILPDSHAKSVLKTGDIIQSINHYPIQTSEQLLQALKNKKPGAKVTLTFERNHTVQDAQVQLMNLQNHQENGPVAANKAGLGITPGTVIKTETPYQIQIKTGNIGGPSAGFMFAVEIVNQLADRDLTKGYRIAGTGTIDPSGHIGQIGGIEHKIVAADREHADIFFVPKDIRKTDTNEKKAIAEAKAIGTKMKIVPVRTLADAIEYLKQLPEHP